VSAYPETTDPLHGNPAEFLRAAYTRVNARSMQAALEHEAALARYDAVTEAVRLLPLAYGDGKAAQDWLIGSMYGVVDEELDRLHARIAWLDAEFDLVHALAAEHGVDLDDQPHTEEEPGHG
jgi:hypothetical protein